MVFIPIRDINRRTWIRYHFVTLLLVTGCVAVFMWQIGLTEQGVTKAFFAFGVIPAVLFGFESLPPALDAVPPAATLVTSIFLHGGWLHLIGNMLFLWVFGDNIEDAMGHRRFLVFFLVCGIAGGLAHAISMPGSTAPLVGASGAISGVLGAYLVLHPRVKVWVLLFSVIPMRLRTWLVLGGWAALNGLNAVYGDLQESGVGWWAHIAGFVAGAVLIRFFKYPHVPLWDLSDRSGPALRGLTLPSQRAKRSKR